MRIEWCKTRARVKHWEEEVELLVEEMQRIVTYLDWDATCWDERGKVFQSNNYVLLEGHHTYVQHQATLCCSLVQRCQDSWIDTIALVKLPYEMSKKDSALY